MLTAGLGHTRVLGQPYAFQRMKHAYIMRTHVLKGNFEEGGSQVGGIPLKALNHPPATHSATPRPLQ
eukprot:1157403-Pelagomonas_calceolata.AAC.7